MASAGTSRTTIRVTCALRDAVQSKVRGGAPIVRATLARFAARTDSPIVALRNPPIGCAQHPCKRGIAKGIQALNCRSTFLDSPRPSQYGPRGLEGAERSRSSFFTAGVGTYERRHERER